MAATDFKRLLPILGVSKTASVTKLNKLDCSKVPPLTWNPNNMEAEARFKEVSEAYEVLSDPENAKIWSISILEQADKRVSIWCWQCWFRRFDFCSHGSFDDFINESLGQFFVGGPSTGRQQPIPIALTHWRPTGFGRLDGGLLVLKPMPSAPRIRSSDRAFCLLKLSRCAALVVGNETIKW